MPKILVMCSECNHKFESRLLQVADQTSFNTMIMTDNTESCPKCGKPVTVTKNVTFE